MGLRTCMHVCVCYAQYGIGAGGDIRKGMGRKVAACYAAQGNAETRTSTLATAPSYSARRCTPVDSVTSILHFSISDKTP